MKQKKYTIFIDETGDIFNESVEGPYGIGFLLVQNGTVKKRVENNLISNGLNRSHAQEFPKYDENITREKTKNLFSCVYPKRQLYLGAYVETNSKYVLELKEHLKAINGYTEKDVESNGFKSILKLPQLYSAALRIPLMGFFKKRSIRNTKLEFHIGVSGYEKWHNKKFSKIAPYLADSFIHSLNKLKKEDIFNGLKPEQIRMKLIPTKAMSPCFVLADLMANLGYGLARNSKKGEWMYDEYLKFFEDKTYNG